MSTERDELATTLSKVRHVRVLHLEVPASIVTHAMDGIAEAILAAGYRKPRTITTAEELDALANGTLLLSGDRIRMYRGAVWRVKSGGMIERVGKELDGVTPFRYFVDPLPATVLYTPEES